MGISSELVWLFVGIVMLASEIFIPGIIIGFFGLGALLTALFTLIGLTDSFLLQAICFLVTSILSLLLLRRLFVKTFAGKTGNEDDVIKLNLDIGRIVPVIELIDPNEVGGKVKYHGVVWSAKAKTRIAPGDNARIIGCDNLVLIVEEISK